MPTQPLSQIPTGSDVFIDANIFVYGLGGHSPQCRHFLERCLREEITGVCLFEIINEATHKFMLAEAASKGLIPKESAGELRKKAHVIPGLTTYWQHTEKILNLNLLLLTTDEPIIRNAHLGRQSCGLLTNDSMILSCMRFYEITSLATNDGDFERVTGITVFQPYDL
jgi:predicted nucleic acid-binding protein